MKKIDRSNTRLACGLGLLLSLGTLLLVPLSIAAEKKDAPTNILLQIYFKVTKEKASRFEAMYSDSYVPAMRKQKGYVGSNLLRLYPDQVSKGIQAAPTEFNYQMELVFDTEVNRTRWVASKEHAKAWPLASSMSEKANWRGYDVVARDEASASD